jgi:hypothetical protein
MWYNTTIMDDGYTHEHIMGLEGRAIRCLTCGIRDFYQDLDFLPGIQLVRRCMECDGTLSESELVDGICLGCLERMGLHLEIEEVLHV